MRWSALVALLGVASVAHAQPDGSASKHDDKSDTTVEAPQAVTSGEAGASDTPKQQAASRFLDGQRKFNEGSFIEAAEAFNAAYELDADPVYLYNSAQAYRRGGACARAADYYRRFLAVVPNPPNLDKVLHYLGDLDACVRAEASSTAETPPAAPVAPPPAPVAPVAPQKVEVAPPPDPRARKLRMLGVATAIGGIAVVGVAAWFTHDVSTLEGYSNALCPQTMLCQWDASKQQRAENLSSRGDRATALAITGYGLGGAALVTGVTLYILGSRGPHDTAPMVAPVPQGGVAGISGRF